MPVPAPLLFHMYTAVHMPVRAPLLFRCFHPSSSTISTRSSSTISTPSLLCYSCRPNCFSAAPAPSKVLALLTCTGMLPAQLQARSLDVARPVPSPRAGLYPWPCPADGAASAASTISAADLSCHPATCTCFYPQSCCWTTHATPQIADKQNSDNTQALLHSTCCTLCVVLGLSHPTYHWLTISIITP